MTETSAEFLTIKTADGVAWVTIDNPPINLFNTPLIRALGAATARLEDDANVRVIVFQSADPDFFIAHGDVNSILGSVGQQGGGHSDSSPFQHLLDRFRLMSKVTIGKIDGIARGGGLELLAALDRSTAHKVLVLNLAPELGETTGFSAERHLHVLSQHAPDFRVDHIVVDSAFVPQGGERDHLARAASRLGAEIVYVDVAESGSHAHHFGKLAAALGSIVTSGDDTATDVPRREGITSWP